MINIIVSLFSWVVLRYRRVLATRHAGMSPSSCQMGELVINVLVQVRPQLGLSVGIDYVRETLSHTRNVTKVSQDCSTVWYSLGLNGLKKRCSVSAACAAFGGAVTV